MPTPPPLPLCERLSLFDFLLAQLGFAKFDEIAKPLRHLPPDEGTGENSRYCQALLAALPQDAAVSAEELVQFDANIARHVAHIGHRRGGLHLRYFQWLIALFAEIYLSRFFGDKELLLRQLEEQWKIKRGGTSNPPYTMEGLSKIALWSATGSGKTLLLHINLLQYRFYLQKHGGKINRTILLVPNDGLAAQHLEELHLSSIDGGIFRKDGALYRGQIVDILSVHKLREESGDKTVAVDYFEDNNLVFVDEGHRGTSGEVWREMRDRLAKNGFSFEYSATFGQITEEQYLQEYSENIWFDYSYHRFYEDGHGKEHNILNLRTWFDDENQKRIYLTACLLTYYRQLRVFADNPGMAREFGVDKPLLVFVGAKVNAVRTVEGRESSDVLDLLKFLSDFVGNAEQAKADIYSAFHEQDKINKVFAGSFVNLSMKDTATVYADVLDLVFNAQHSAALRISAIGGADGEIAVLVGEHSPFGVINIGDRNKFIKLCGEQMPDMVSDPKHFADSLFHGINDSSSKVQMLIGAKKFTEGWNSWRVSTMGFLNIGRSEGTEIIQLFGRGVRLRGFGGQLKRRKAMTDAPNKPMVDHLETLNIFGVRADFMEAFREYMEREGVDTEHEKVLIPVVHNLGGAKLKIIRVRPNDDFKKERVVEFVPPQANGGMKRVSLDCRPRVQVMGDNEAITREWGDKIEKSYKPYFDRARMYEELLEYKSEKQFYNMLLPRSVVDDLLASDSWYNLIVAPSDKRADSFAVVYRWEQIATELMKKYIRACWMRAWNQWEAKKRQYEDLDESDPNFIDKYQFLVNKSHEALFGNLEKIGERILAGEIPRLDVHNVPFSRHLYEPLLYIGKDRLVVNKSPSGAVLDAPSEKKFVDNLRAYFEKKTDFFADKKLYLLRNRSRGRGVGFFEANGFYPDFIMWLLADGLQHIVFVDPKGVRNLASDDKKIKFYQTVQDEIEKPMSENMPEVRLHSFIVSETPHHELLWRPLESVDKYAAQNLLFVEDDLHIERMFAAICARR